MRIIKRANEKTGKRSPELLGDCAEMTGRGLDLNFVSQMAGVQKLNLVKEELTQVNKDHYTSC